jgi:hypothetical protein
MRIVTAGLALAWTLSAAALPAAPVSGEQKKDKAATPADKIRQALDKTINVELKGVPLPTAAQQLSETIGVPLVLDTFTIQQMGFDPAQMQTHFNGKDVKARTALRSILGQFNLSFAIVGDNVLVTTDEMAMYRQMRQRVNVDFDGTEFATAIKQLARDTATNLIIDARSAKEAKGPITLQLEDVPLETAVRLMSEMVGLKPVRVGNVMFICSKAAANDLKTDTDLVPPPPAPGPRAVTELVLPFGAVPALPLAAPAVPVPPPAAPVPPTGVPAPKDPSTVPTPAPTAPPPDKQP